MPQLIELCELIVDCEHKTAPTQDTGYPSIRTPNIGKGRLILDGVNRVSAETYKAWTQRQVPKPGDLILAREAPIGNVAIITPGLEVCLGQRTVLIRTNRKKLNPQYLTYLMLGDEIQGRILSMSNGATVHHLNMKDIRELEMPPIPGLAVQDRIASILSAYDDLIENNTRRIKILEEMVQMLYREWFVNFRFPGHQKVQMVESELGPIPEGWNVEPLAEVYKTGSGGTPSRKIPSYYGGAIPWVKTQELQDGFIHNTDEKITEEGLKNSSAKLHPPGAVLMAMYGATIGKLGMLALPATCNQACCALTPKEPHFGSEYIFLALLNRRPDILALRMGAAQQNISQEVIKAFPLMRPNTDVMDRFNETVKPLMALIGLLQAKNSNLRTTRDLLLPKLISGEIPVEAAAELVEQTA
jgi:type I restriction enzyme S subunit